MKLYKIAIVGAVMMVGALTAGGLALAQAPDEPTDTGTEQAAAKQTTGYEQDARFFGGGRHGFGHGGRGWGYGHGWYGRGYGARRWWHVW
jgi:hypothetical protein